MANKRNSLVENINRRKRAGKSRPKKKSTVSKAAYQDMQEGWPGRKQKSGKKSNTKGKQPVLKTAARKKTSSKKAKTTKRR